MPSEANLYRGDAMFLGEFNYRRVRRNLRVSRRRVGGEHDTMLLAELKELGLRLVGMYLNLIHSWNDLRRLKENLEAIARTIVIKLQKRGATGVEATYFWTLKLLTPIALIFPASYNFSMSAHVSLKVGLSTVMNSPASGSPFGPG